MIGFLISIAAVLLPLPKHYSETRGLNRNPEVTVAFVDSIPGAGSHQDEAYALHVTRKGIQIEAVTPVGEIRARQTLAQLRESSGRRGIRCCEITDWAAFPYRGVLQDIGRSYIGVEELKTEIRTLASFKINVFHWHLTENQAWRLESSIYPAINAPESMTRFPGKYYTKAEVREIKALCDSVGMSLVPELDLPGHSAAFTRAFGCDMQSEKGAAILRELIAEACETFAGCEWFHIGTDEVRVSNTELIPSMVELIRSKGFKVISYNPGWKYAPGEIDALQLWSYRGTAMPGTPAIDSKLHYVNHFDTFADLKIFYDFKPYGRDECDGDIIGAEIALWHDRLVSSEDLMVRENGLYPVAAALADRTWGGGEAGSFADFEDRFLFFKERTMQGLPVTYVRQSNVRWGITEAFPNGGDLAASFPPENETPSKYAAGYADGAGVYLRHVWGGAICPQFFKDPQPNSTAYAWTYVWSDRDQDAGALIEFQNYSRSEKDLPPPQGAWDWKGSRAWLNGEEILPPVWGLPSGVCSGGRAEAVSGGVPAEAVSGGGRDLAAFGGVPAEVAQPTSFAGVVAEAAQPTNEDELGNENLTARPPMPVHLKKGWNYVLLKLPVGEFNTREVRLVKWMFNFVLVTPDGSQALPGLKYDPAR